MMNLGEVTDKCGVHCFASNCLFESLSRLCR